MRPAAEAEKVLGIPAVVVTLPGFNTVGKLTAKASGVPDLKLVEYPGAVGLDHHEIRGKIKDVLFDRIVDALTKPVEATTVPKADVWNSKAIVATGTYDEINEAFFEKEWTDGLPITPPTLKRVEAFLKFTDRAPDEVIAVLPQANLRATVWNIAANGVMAGCKPQHMPLLIAMAEALQEDKFNLNNIGTTWGIMPYVIINGPLVKQLGINSGAGLISRGANPVLGRALGLIIRNIGGYRPALNQMGSYGYPISYCLAENEDLSPWEPLHVERGFDRNASTVSIGTTLNWGYSPSPYAREDKTGAECALEVICRDVVRKPCLGLFAEVGPTGFVNDVVFAITPPVAKSLADAGYSKNDIKEYVAKNARVTLGYMKYELAYTMAMTTTVEEKLALGMFPQDYECGDDDLVPIIPGADHVEIIVSGDPGRNRIKTMDSGYTRLTTREVKLPKNWDELMKGSR
ncbi:MAG: hypothetical protein V4787_12425 [Pseudomonadota bacterium]